MNHPGPAGARRKTTRIARGFGFAGRLPVRFAGAVPHLCFLLVLCLGWFSAAAAWDLSHGLLFTAAGLLMLVFRPRAALPRSWWLLAGLFLVGAALAFLPAGWFGLPPWRDSLAALGVATGPLQAMQPRHAGETLAVFAVALVVALWLAGHRTDPPRLARAVLWFSLAVAGYAVASYVRHRNAPGASFGFFPNRNHSATLLAMGSVCGVASTVQAIRDKRWGLLAAALAAGGLCLWATLAWSASRAGVLLLAAGLLVWLACLGPRYLGRHAARALGLLVVLVAGAFLIADSQVKQRLAASSEKIDDIQAEPADKPTLDQLGEVDFRVPVWRDTVAMIAAAPWSGVGAGQFATVFPQYRRHTTVANDSDCAHPESDWLWLAAETGVPATLALLALAGVAAWYALRHTLNGRRRALRAGCLAGALLLAIHAFFDVPGHRIPLAWAAALLFSLSLPAPDETRSRRPPGWPLRLAGAAVLAAGVWLLGSAYSLAPPPALVAGPAARTEAQRLFREDRELQLATEAAGKTYEPPPGQDRLEQALALLKRTAATLPLDRRLWRLRGFLALHFDDPDYDNFAKRAFAIERALDPTWVRGPLEQGLAWAPIDPEQAASLWAEALARARQLDRQHPDRQSESATLAQIARLTRGNPPLEQAWQTRSRSLPPGP